VGDYPDEKHDSYWTLLHFICGAGADHHSVLQLISLLFSWDGVTFADNQRNRDLMSEYVQKAADELNKIEDIWRRRAGDLVRVAGIQEHCDSHFQAVDNHHKTMQQEVNKSTIQLVLVGFLQNAIQLKVQITMFSLNYSLTGEVEKLFLFGIVGNFASYCFNLSDCWDLFSLFMSFHKDTRAMERMKAKMKKNLVLNIEQFEVLEHRRKFLKVACVVFLMFTVCFILFFVYLLVNFAMIFQCHSRIWNISIPPLHGCVELPATHVGTMFN